MWHRVANRLAVFEMMEQKFKILSSANYNGGINEYHLYISDLEKGNKALVNSN